MGAMLLLGIRLLDLTNNRNSVVYGPPRRRDIDNI
jgi:hypothetical protein